MRKFIGLCLVLAMCACDAEQAEELEIMYPNETAKIEQLIQQVGPLDLKKPELMTAEQREKWLSSAYDRASQARRITIGSGFTLILPPGTYYNTNNAVLTWLDINGNAWTLGTSGSFCLKGQVPITNVGVIDAQINYYPDKSDQGTPLIRAFNEAAGTIQIQIPFGGTGTAIERTAAGAFVRSYVAQGPLTIGYIAAAGNSVTISMNAYL